MTDRDRIERTLSHVRNALLANKYGGSVLPALLGAEEELLHLLFSPQEVFEYLESPGAKVYGR